MKFKDYSPSITEAKALQKELAACVITQDAFPLPIRYVAGLDVSHNRFDPHQMIYAAAALLSYPDLTLIETTSHVEQQPFPYISGLLGFREAPAMLQVFKKLSIEPDMLLIDGHGVSHPRGLGIASHLGVLVDKPTIGIAKSILVGIPEGVL